MKYLVSILFIVSALSNESIYKNEIIKEMHGDIFMGEPFLTSDKSLNKLWFEISG